MQVVLLQRVENLGQMGEVVTVKPGFARNFLIPRKKALRATKDNLAFFEAQRKTLEAVNAKTKAEAESTAAKMDKLSVIVIRQAAESGKLYGSVSTRDVSEAVNAKGFKTSREQVTLTALLADERNLCDLCRRHHHRVTHGYDKLGLAQLPRGIADFAREFGIGWMLDRELRAFTRR